MSWIWWKSCFSIDTYSFYPFFQNLFLEILLLAITDPRKVIADHTIDTVKGEIISQKHASIQAAACKTLGCIQSSKMHKEVSEQLLKMLSSEEPNTAKAALDALVKLVSIRITLTWIFTGQWWCFDSKRTGRRVEKDKKCQCKRKLLRSSSKWDLCNLY